MLPCTYPGIIADACTQWRSSVKGNAHRGPLNVAIYSSYTYSSLQVKYATLLLIFTW